jgi:hypothetical protein
MIYLLIEEISESMTRVIIITTTLNVSRVSLIKEDPKAAHDHEHDWYINF